MRTLKKALCLVLVLSMVMGIGVIGAGAAYSDADQIEYQEAVDVMSAIGVMQGVGDNTFDPNGTFTRAQAAKMLSYMILGETAAEALPARSDFTDVSADQWFSKYIGFGVSEGYLAGMGDGSFKPDDPVTGYQWAKMLLCALGYDPKTEGLEGNGYEINVAKLALTKVKLFEGNEGADYNADATREEAALYAFNTLTKTMVSYEKSSTVIINGVEVVISQGEAKDVTNDAATETIADDNKMQFAEQYFSKLVLTNAAGTADAFGRPAVKWTYDGESVGTYADKPVLTYTSGFDADALTDLKNDGYTFPQKVYVNGAEDTNLKTIDDVAARDYVGTIVELYSTDNDAKTIEKIVLIQSYLTKVTNIVSSNKTATNNYITLAVYNPWDSSDVVNVTFRDTASTTVESTYDKLVAAYAKDEYLLTYWTGADVAEAHYISAEKATSTTATVTSTKMTGASDGYNGTIVAGGTTYTLASGYAEYTGVGGALTLNKDYTLYFDANGFVIGAVPVSAVDGITLAGTGDTFEVYEYYVKSGTDAADVVFFFVYQP